MASKLQLEIKEPDICLSHNRKLFWNRAILTPIQFFESDTEDCQVCLLDFHQVPYILNSPVLHNACMKSSTFK